MKQWSVHADLVKRMAAWLRGRGCALVVTELVTAAREVPDVLGWGDGGISTLVECKVSRSDYCADLRKLTRTHPYLGLGTYRYFATPVGLVRSIAELPDGWGLLEAQGRSVHIVFPATLQTANKDMECRVLLSVIRRMRAVEAGNQLNVPTIKKSVDD